MIFALALVSLIAFAFLFVIKQMYVFKLTEHIPGPTPLPFIGNALELGTNTADLLKNLLRLTKTYGSVVRVCMGSQVGVLLTDPKYTAQVLATTESYHKGDLYKIVQPLVGDGLITSTETVMGVDITENVQYHRNADKISDLFLKRFMSPLKMSDFFYRFTSEYRETKTCAKFINDFVDDVMNKHKQEFTKESKNNQYTSMLDEMLRLSGEHVLTHEEILDEVKTFTFAGSDTAGVTLSFAMYELAKHSSIQAKLLEEIESVLGTNTEEGISYEDLHLLQYTECVVKEVMRIYAPKGCYYEVWNSDDLYVPANTLALVFIYGLHHTEKFYPDPEKFVPDRFLPENLDIQHKNSYIPFASGARTCIGNKFAMLEAKLTLAKIIRNFEIFEKPGHELVATGNLKSANGLPVKLKLRRPAST